MKTKASRKKWLVFPIVMLMSLVSCSEIKNKDIREQTQEKHGKPDKVEVYFRDNMCLNEYWRYKTSEFSYWTIRFENCGFGFYLVDEHYQPITEKPHSGNSTYIFTRNPKAMRALLMEMYGKPITIKKKLRADISIAPVDEYWIYEDERKVLIIQDTTFFYKEEYGEGYTTTKGDEQK